MAGNVVQAVSTKRAKERNGRDYNDHVMEVDTAQVDRTSPPRIGLQIDQKFHNNSRSFQNVPKSPTILEVPEDSSPSSFNFLRDSEDQDKNLEENPNERTNLISSGRRKNYRGYDSDPRNQSSDADNPKDKSEDDEKSCLRKYFLSRFGFLTKFKLRQQIVFFLIMTTTLSSSFAVCLFPPFFPKLAEMKGCTATHYGMIIGTNCLVAFLVTPHIGNSLNQLGVKFALFIGLISSGVCCGLSGGLAFFEAGLGFMIVSTIIRAFHATANACIITSTFTYNASEFPESVAKIFALSRTAMNLAQLGGPMLGGALYDWGGFHTPFMVMGCIQIGIAFFALCLMPEPELIETESEETERQQKKKGKVSVLKMLKIPTIWFSFSAFIIATMCNGFLSINLEPQVLRRFHMNQFNVGVIFGLKDGANSFGSPIWGWICDKWKWSVKTVLIVSAGLVAMSFLILGGGIFLGLNIPVTLSAVVVGLCLNGLGIGGQQVAGVVDALHEAVGAGYPDEPSTHGLVAGLWSSLSGFGRFTSRAGSGILVDYIGEITGFGGFNSVAFMATSLQIAIGSLTAVYISLASLIWCGQKSRKFLESIIRRFNEDSMLDEVFDDNSSDNSEPSTNSSASVDIATPNDRLADQRIAFSMPPKSWYYDEETSLQPHSYRSWHSELCDSQSEPRPRRRWKLSTPDCETGK